MVPPNNDSNWNEYAKLVLAELERHNRILIGIEEKLDSMKLQQALYDREQAQVRLEVKHLKQELAETRKIVMDFTNTDLAEQAVKKYKKYVIGLVFAVVASIVIPLAKLLVLGV